MLRKTRFPAQITRAILSVVTDVPTSKEQSLQNPDARIQELIQKASWKAAAVSGALALPSGPISLLTLLPDLVTTWRIQAQLVADVAAVYGKSKKLEKEELMYCLFNYGRQSPLKDFVVRAGERFLVRELSAKMLQQLAEKLGLKLAQKILGRGFSRLIPVAGAIGVARYAKYDTRLVGTYARDLFSKEIVKEAPSSP